MMAVNQDPNAHLFYEVDWLQWLTSRGFSNDQIVSLTANVSSGTANVTYTAVEGSRIMIWVQGVLRNKEAIITTRIQMPEPASGIGYVMDEYSFTIFGRQR